MKNYMIHTNRRSLLKHLLAYFNTFSSFKTETIKIKNTNRQVGTIHPDVRTKGDLTPIHKLRKEIESNKVEYFIFSNGTDAIDVKIKNLILEINPHQKLLFSENGWLTWQDFLYLDGSGIGNNSQIFSHTDKDMPKVKISTKLKELSHKKTMGRLSEGAECPFDNYIVVPLQVNNDSKMIIGSPHFKTVKDFVDYIVSTTPSDINILFKNHPKNKNKTPIPKAHNVVDVTGSRYSKKSLIEKSHYVAGINSTFLIESLFLRHKTVTFGLDVFTNKGIIIEGMGKSYDDIVSKEVNLTTIENFINLLISRQIPKTHIAVEYKKAIQ